MKQKEKKKEKGRGGGEEGREENLKLYLVRVIEVNFLNFPNRHKGNIASELNDDNTAE